MAISLKYNASEDRLLVTVRTEQGPVALWMTRHHVIGILRALSLLPKSGSGELPLKNKPNAERGKGNLTCNDVNKSPVIARAVRVRQTQGGIRLAMTRDGSKFYFIEYKSEDIPKIFNFFRKQADIAGWDVDAAFARVDASSTKKPTRSFKTLH